MSPFESERMSQACCHYLALKFAESGPLLTDRISLQGDKVTLSMEQLPC
jgi:hypothetical protein